MAAIHDVRIGERGLRHGRMEGGLRQCLMLWLSYMEAPRLRRAAAFPPCSAVPNFVICEWGNFFLRKTPLVRGIVEAQSNQRGPAHIPHVASAGTFLSVARPPASLRLQFVTDIKAEVG